MNEALPPNARANTLRWLCLLAVFAAIAVAILVACDPDDPEDRRSHVGPGALEKDASIDVLGARIVSDSHGEGRVIGALVNNTEKPAALESVSGVSDDIVVVMRPVRIGGDDHVNLAADPILRASGSFSAGDFVMLRYSFSTGESVTVNVPVVKQCKYYKDLTLYDDPGDEDTSGDTYLCAKELEVPPGGGYLEDDVRD